MKRPLFCVALAYALGEVIGVCTRTMEEISIAAVMLICAGIYAVGVRKCRCAGVVLGSLLFGMTCAFLYVPEDMRQQKTEVASEEGHYQILTYGKEEESRTEAVIMGILADKQGDDWVLRVCDIRMEQPGSAQAESIFAWGAKEQAPRYVLLRGCGDVEGTGDEEQYNISDVVTVRGTLCTFDKVGNPGGFDARVYYKARNIDGYLYQPDVEEYTQIRPDYSVWTQGLLLYYRGKQHLYGLRDKFDMQLHAILPEKLAALYSGILLGDKTEITMETKKLYQIGGIAHILAISGLHISLFGGLFFRLLRRCTIPYPAAGVLAIIVTWGYGCFTGMSLATMRAAAMLSVFLVAQILGKKYDMPTSMGIALSLMLLANPVRILDSGMQLSYMAIGGVTFGHYLLRRFHKHAGFRRFEKKHRMRFRIVQSLVYAGALNLMMLPVLAKSYYILPVYAWLLNLIVVPCMTIVVMSGWCGVLMAFIAGRLGQILITPGEYLLRVYEWLCHLTIRIPGNALCTGEIHLPMLAVWYGGIILAVVLEQTRMRNRIRDYIYKHTGRFWRRKQVIRYIVGSLAFVVVAEGIAQAGLFRTYHVEEVCFLDVGQGDGILIRSAGGSTIVIDGGSTSETSVGNYTLLPALKSQGILTVDYWFVTHTDADHINGLTEILEMGSLAQVQIQTVVFSAYVVRDEAYEQLVSLLTDHGVEIVWMQEQDAISDGTFTLQCLHPDQTYVPADKNAASLALAYHSDTFDLLFTGDMNADAVEDMLGAENWKTVDDAGMDGSDGQAPRQSTDEIEYDCVKLPHHGSKYSYSENLYARTKYAVISCGKKNRYGHPHAEVLEGLEQAGVQALRTDEVGAVIFRSR